MKHEIAYCKNGEMYTPNDIKSRKSLVEMRYYGLTDVNKQFELVAVNSQNPFFRFKNSPGISLTRSENNPNHTLIKNLLIEKLNSAKSLLIYTYEFINNEKFESSIINICPEIYSSYRWKLEPFKKISNTEYSYFDICGYATDEPFSSSIKPTIIIEVVLSSFLKERVFEYQCKSSKIDNTICLFFYIPYKLPNNQLSNYWNALDENNGEIKMRISHYIDNGYFFENKTPIAYLGKDIIKSENYERPIFNIYNEERKYWDKHHIYINDYYIKKAMKKLEN